MLRNRSSGTGGPEREGQSRTCPRTQRKTCPLHCPSEAEARAPGRAPCGLLLCMGSGVEGAPGSPIFWAQLALLCGPRSKHRVPPSPNLPKRLASLRPAYLSPSLHSSSWCPHVPSGHLPPPWQSQRSRPSCQALTPSSLPGLKALPTTHPHPGATI